MTNFVSKPLSLQPNYTLTTHKSLGTTANPAPAQAPAGENLASQCMDWVNQNRSVYEAIVSGGSGLSQADQSQFMQYWSYAISTAHGSNWNPAPVLGAQDPTMGQPQANLPAGAKLGPMGNIVFNTEKAESTYAPSNMPTDVLSDEFTLNVDSKVKDVSVEKTKDTRLNPATDVIKITVKDPFSAPSETTYFVQPEAKININTIGAKGVTQKGTESLKLDDGSAQITVGKYSDADSSGSDTAESSMPGVEDKMNPGTLTYKPDFEGETIDFHSLPGKDQTHEVYANANISVRPGDKADATLESTGDLKIVVSHDDGTKDTYEIKKGYNANININKAYMTFGSETRQDGKIPQDIAPRLKVSGMDAATEPEKASPFIGTLIKVSSVRFSDLIQPSIPAAPPALHPVHGD